ncbi:MAG TPA: pepsin/retropepsin-like aspartic protease family protein [Casimicrobiaceae bacterium]|nr:pepsin/retropepsin-like aspartic protease family protein [Casimicrobiaceae bacterium]
MIRSRIAVAALMTVNALVGASANAQCAAPIPLEIGGPRPAVDISLANGRTAKAVFDTGAMATIVNVEKTAELGLSRSGPLEPPYSGHGAANGFQVTLPGLAVGAYPVGDVSAPAIASPLPNVAIVLSPSVFGDRLVELDLGHARLTVCDKNEATAKRGEANAYSAPPFALPTVDVEVGGRKFAAHLDTGSPITVLFPKRYAESLPLQGPLEQSGTVRTHWGEQAIYKAKIAGPLRIGPLTLDSPEVRFTDLVQEVNVGTQVLRQLRITLDPSGHRSWIEKSA